MSKDKTTTICNIESAPRDGSEILAFDDRGNCSLVAWTETNIGYTDQDLEPGWYRRAEGDWDLFDGFAPQKIDAIAWAPIPVWRMP